MTSEEIIAGYGNQLLEEGAPALARAEELETSVSSPVRVFIAASHAAVSEVLEDEARFSLEHYDLLLAEVAGDTRYFVGENTPGRQQRLAMLRAAQDFIARSIPYSPSPEDRGKPVSNQAYLDWVAAIVRDECHSILTILRQRGLAGGSPRLRRRLARPGKAAPGDAGRVSGAFRPAPAPAAAPVNLVREFAYLAAYRTARRILGVSSPDRPPLLARILMLARNLVSPGHWIALRGELGNAQTLVALLQPLFGHVFGTIVSSPAVLRLPSASAAGSALAALDRQIDDHANAPEQSLLAALAAVRPQFDGQIDEATYHDNVRSILFELQGALVLVAGKSLAEICGLLSSPGACAGAGTGWAQVIALLRSGQANGAAHQAVISELLRLTGGNRLVRTVRDDTAFHGIALNRGDRILVLVNLASRDARAFPSPGRFDPEAGRPFVTFGPLGGPHACYGQFIARTMIREAMLALDGVLEPDVGCELRAFLGIPDDLAWKVCAAGTAPDDACTPVSPALLE